jgi:UDP-N-acetylmuramate--alanine ligase
VLKGEEFGEVTIHMPGEHNVKNALAAIAVGLEMDIEFPTIRKALNHFSGVRRRFEIIGEAQGVLIVDDYGHHPTEIRATLRAARQGWNRRIVAVFQPHLYTRTRDFHREFGEVFLEADVLRVMEIYPAREKPIAGITGEMVANAAREAGHPDAAFSLSRQIIFDELQKICREGDMVITFGAGDVGNVAHELFKRLGGGINSGIVPDLGWRVPE